MKSIFTALHFLTRLNVKKRIIYKKEDYQKSLVFFPLIGFLIGIILYFIGIKFQLLFQPFTTAVILISFETLITGGLHLDGFMDSCDGLFSGRERGKKLEIMKDSRVGAMGAIGVIILFLLKLSFLLELMEGECYFALLVMPMIGRWSMAFAINLYPYARTSGLGSMFQSGKRSYFFWTSFYSVIIFLLIVPYGPQYLSLPLVFIGITIITKRINSLLGGLTGDTYGMINEITELLFLFCTVLISKI